MTDTTTPADLLPCPFCGERSHLREYDQHAWPIIRCGNCGACGPCTHSTEEKAEAAWQARAALSAPEQDDSDALEQFHRFGADKETDPIERLRAFCSYAMKGQDWLDVEPFFAALSAPAPTNNINFKRAFEKARKNPAYWEERASLERESQPAQEPLAWAEIGEDELGGLILIGLHFDKNNIKGDHRRLPLYAHPQHGEKP